jgi:hypothetical protein
MGGTVSNLPPGVSVNDIPGNRPEDVAEEKFFNELDKRLMAVNVTVKSLHDEVPEFLWDTPWFVQVITIARDIGYAEGYNAGKLEAELVASEDS